MTKEKGSLGWTGVRGRKDSLTKKEGSYEGGWSNYSLINNDGFWRNKNSLTKEKASCTLLEVQHELRRNTALLTKA